VRWPRLELHPIIGPVANVRRAGRVGIIAVSTIGAGLLARRPLRADLPRGPFHHADDYRTQTRAQHARRCSWRWHSGTWLWGPMGAFLSSPLLIVGLIIKNI